MDTSDSGCVSVQTDGRNVRERTPEELAKKGPALVTHFLKESNNESLTGSWWLPEDPHHDVSGSLKLSRSSGQTLVLLGNVDRHRELGLPCEEFDNDVEYKVIHGLTDEGELVSLFDCVSTLHRATYHSLPSEGYWVKVRLVVVGAHLRSTGGECFSALRGLRSTLPYVTDLGGLKAKLNEGDVPQGLHFGCLLSSHGLRAETTGGQLLVEFNAAQESTVSPSGYNLGFTIKPQVNLQVNEESSNPLELVETIGNLIDITCWFPGYWQSVYAANRDGPETLQVIGKFLGPIVEQDPAHGDILGVFDEVNLSGLLESWLQLSEKKRYDIQHAMKSTLLLDQSERIRQGCIGLESLSGQMPQEFCAKPVLAPEEADSLIEAIPDDLVIDNKNSLTSTLKGLSKRPSMARRIKAIREWIDPGSVLSSDVRRGERTIIQLRDGASHGTESEDREEISKPDTEVADLIVRGYLRAYTGRSLNLEVQPFLEKLKKEVGRQS